MARNDASPRRPTPLRPIAGGAEESRVARWMEQAGSHQTRALMWLRRSRDPAAGAQAPAQRRDFLLRALEHLVSARRLLERARDQTQDPNLLAILEEHLTRLATTAASTERLLLEIDAAQGQ